MQHICFWNLDFVIGYATSENHPVIGRALFARAAWVCRRDANAFCMYNTLLLHPSAMPFSANLERCFATLHSDCLPIVAGGL